MSAKVVVWTPGDARIWWACPACKVEAGISPPVDMDELIKRVEAFKATHKDCNNKEGIQWRVFGL